MRAATVVKLSVVLAAALAVTAVAIVSSTDFSRYKSEIAAYVERSTGRKLEIDGEFRLRMGLRPSLSADSVRFANAPWGTQPAMATAEHFSAEIRMLPLLFGELRIDRLVLTGAEILLETDAAGRANWIFEEPAPGAVPEADGAAPRLPSFERVRVERARIVWRDATGKADEATVNTLDAEADGAGSPVHIVLRGLYGGSPLALDGTFGPLAGLAQPAEPWPFDISAEAGGASLALAGTARDPLAGTGVDATIAMHGEDLSRLGAVVRQTLPALGPWRLEARLSDTGTTWTARNLAAAVGRSAVTGELSYDAGQAPARLRGTLTASLVDVADFAAPPSGQVRGPAIAAPAARAPSDGRLFGTDPLPIEALAGLDAEIALRASRLMTGVLVFADAATDLRIKAGTLEAGPAKATLAGAPVTAALGFGPGDRGAPPKLAVRLNAAGLDVAALLKDAGRPGLATGRIDLAADLKGSGRSPRALMAGLAGTAEITMGEGRVSNDTVDLLSADVITAIAPWAPRQGDLRVRCMVGRYDIREGRLASRVTLFDSDRVMLVGEGGLNLATEQIGFTVVPHAKDASLLRLAMPIRIGGTLSSPTAYPDAERMARGAASFVVGLPGAVVDTAGGLLGLSDGKADPCAVARAAGGPKEAAPTPAGGIGQAIEEIGKGIGQGLKSIFGP